MEICVDSLESAKNAVEGGATRLEVCSALSKGGLTPTPGVIKQIRTFARIPLYAMIRIRDGNFVYTDEEKDAMLHDLMILKDHCVDGFVFGALTLDYEIDIVICKKIISAACPLPVTFNRAFDLTTDPFKSLEILANLGFKRILTSGQKSTAVEGLKLIKTLVQKSYNYGIIIMPGAGITKNNISKIIESGAKEFHASAKQKKRVIHDIKSIKMGIDEENFVNITDKELVKELVTVIKTQCIDS
ncbi:hypothetical protein DMN91_002155 [Ooceraea biroi]|uniref:Copper homeostasis protein cutC homolog n=1 Tax=Ooceraea biroi TaxID=2015173 RepID=A0A026WH50_OOCBI|nr:copper homeostasis protein cutC homolog isoform X1 [Ooceraea biroi]XP_011337140.1 copper homeostasis protein cutC homolog isoform X1 [Ooceraea biroi]EZA55360.1 Copper homeostasis protein cutC-like protein [Ooceraea biroi]RLU25992.1 hypothetical protein DMN91_002155 [Ooceraea biroi]